MILRMMMMMTKTKMMMNDYDDVDDYLDEGLVQPLMWLIQGDTGSELGDTIIIIAIAIAIIVIVIVIIIVPS